MDKDDDQMLCKADNGVVVLDDADSEEENLFNGIVQQDRAAGLALEERVQAYRRTVPSFPMPAQTLVQPHTTRNHRARVTNFYGRSSVLGELINWFRAEGL